LYVTIVLQPLLQNLRRNPYEENTLRIYHGKIRDILLNLGVFRGLFATIVAKVVAKIASFLQLLQQRGHAESHKTTMTEHLH
jgi:hypothetical protein